MNRAFSAVGFTGHEILGRCPRLQMNGAVGANKNQTRRFPFLMRRTASARDFPEIASLSATGAIHYIAWGNAPGLGSNSKQALKARFNPPRAISLKDGRFFNRRRIKTAISNRRSLKAFETSGVKNEVRRAQPP
jgi:hypothetical protein